MEEAAVSIIGLKELLQLPEHVNATNGLNLCIHGLLISICSWLTLLMVTDAFLLIKHVNGSLQRPSTPQRWFYAFATLLVNKRTF